MSAQLVAEIPTRQPSRVVRVYLTPEGSVYVGEYERRTPKGEPRPTVRAVLLPRERALDLAEAIRAAAALDPAAAA